MSDDEIVIDTSKAEIASIKNILEIVTSQRDALDQTVKEILAANINLKAASSLLEKKVKIQENDINDKELKIIELQIKIKELEIASMPTNY